MTLRWPLKEFLIAVAMFAIEGWLWWPWPDWLLTAFGMMFFVLGVFFLIGSAIVERKEPRK